MLIQNFIAIRNDCLTWWDLYATYAPRVLMGYFLIREFLTLLSLTYN